MRLSLFCALALLSCLALAQGSTNTPASNPSPKPSDEKRSQAKELFFRAEASYKAGEYKKASETYQKAFELYQEPALLYNAGQCQYKLGDFEGAISFYRRYLSMVPNSPLRPELERLFAMSKVIHTEEIKETPPPQEPPKEPIKEAPVEEPPQEEPKKEVKNKLPERSAFIYTESKTKSFLVQVRSKEEVFTCPKRVSASSPCVLKDLPEGELTVEMGAGKRASYQKSFQMQEGGVELGLGYRGSIKKFVFVTSALFIAGSVRAAVENKDNTWALAIPFLGGAYWSSRNKFRPWNKVTVTPGKAAEDTDELSLGESEVVP